MNVVFQKFLKNGTKLCHYILCKLPTEKVIDQDVTVQNTADEIDVYEFENSEKLRNHI